MTDVNKAWAYLRQTKSAGANLKVWPPTDKNSYWYKAGVELGVITAGPPPPPPPPPTGSMGAALRADFPPLTGLPVTDDAGKPSRGSVVLLDGSSDGGEHFKNVRRVGGSNDGFKIAGGAHDVRFDLCSAIDIHPSTLAMAWNFQRAPRNVQVYGGENHNIGSSTRDHIAYIGAGSRDILFAGVLGYDFSGYGAHIYPGPATHIAIANCTFVGSKQRAGAIFDGSGITDVLFVNSIIEDVVYRGGSNVRFVNCCVFGQRDSGPAYTDCILENPGFDAQFKPSNQKLLNGGLAGWMAPHDCRGNAYSRATIGAVAA